VGSDFKKRDRFGETAKREGFSARSVYKLEELDKKFHLLRQGHRVVDIGASPGSWMQYVAKIVLPSGYLLGLDLNEITAPLPVTAIRAQMDILTATPEDFAALGATPGSIDVVLSDTSPKTTGIKITDRARSLELVEMGYEAAKVLLKPGGAYVFKVFVSNDYQAFEKKLRPEFERVLSQRPDAVRSGSEERYVLCLGFQRR
jgi:23S rRNA (uridine2552-2'-O)-methyltransferase